MLKESQVENILRGYLISKGWRLTNLPKGIGEGGIDIKGYHPIKRKVLLVEVKGDGKAKNQTLHNGFYTILGQILFRMDKQGNDQKKARTYALAIPANWEDAFTKKIKQMPYGWSLLRLKVFLVSNRSVEEKNYKYFLK
ncbi:MAG: hypothetical protein NTZ49_00115 [Candidatus Parcubacteria bacterium]|nr:hypothetical protein [Candidatus Parcubacteria bacterium]